MWLAFTYAFTFDEKDLGVHGFVILIYEVRASVLTTNLHIRHYDSILGLF